MLPKFYNASRYLSFSNDLELTSINLASYFSKKVKPKKRVPTERHHVNIHETKFGSREESIIRPDHNKGKVLFFKRSFCFFMFQKLFLKLSKDIASDYFQKNVVLPTLDDVVNPNSSRLEVVEIAIVHTIDPLKELCSKYRPEFRQLNHPFRETLKTLTKICNRKKKVNVTRLRTLHDLERKPDQHESESLV